MFIWRVLAAVGAVAGVVAAGYLLWSVLGTDADEAEFDIV